MNMEGTANTAGERIGLREVRLTNCQAYEDIILPFAEDRLNVLVADNNIGKSIFFKMLDITACPERYDTEDRVGLIRHGAEFAQIMFAFTDDAIAATRVLRNKVLYYYREPGGQRFQMFSSIPDEMLCHLGLLVDRSEGFIANIIDSDHDLLLIDSNEKSNHNALKMITESNELASFQSVLDSKLLELADIKLKVDDRLSTIKQQMSGYQYVDERELQENINRCDSLFRLVYTIDDMNTSLHNLSYYRGSTKDYDRLLRQAEAYQSLHQAALAVGSCTAVAPFDEHRLMLVETIIKVGETAGAVGSYQRSRDIPEYLFCMLGMMERLMPATEALVADFRADHYGEHVKMYRALTAVSRVCTALGSYDKHKQMAEDAAAKAITIAGLLRKKNATYSCGIYGEVFSDGEKCIPVNL